MNKNDLCEFCDGSMEHRTVRARFCYKSEILYINNVPAWVCNHCGEQYFDAPTYKRMEQIAKNRDKIQNRISFPLAEYDVVGL